MLIEAFVQMRANQLAPDDEAQVEMPDRTILADLSLGFFRRAPYTTTVSLSSTLTVHSVGVACWSVVNGALKGLVGLEDLLQWLEGGARWWIRSTHVDWSR